MRRYSWPNGNVPCLVSHPWFLLLALAFAGTSAPIETHHCLLRDSWHRHALLPAICLQSSGLRRARPDMGNLSAVHRHVCCSAWHAVGAGDGPGRRDTRPPVTRLRRGGRRGRQGRGARELTAYGPIQSMGSRWADTAMNWVAGRNQSSRLATAGWSTPDWAPPGLQMRSGRSGGRCLRYRENRYPSHCCQSGRLPRCCWWWNCPMDPRHCRRHCRLSHLLQLWRCKRLGRYHASVRNQKPPAPG